jgi:hypothetical protein
MSDWWSKKLSGNPAPTPRQDGAPISPLPNVRYVPEGNMHSTPVTYDPNQDNLVVKAQSARFTEKCPGCFSGNYFAPMGTQLKRCYDCGYPIQQSGSGGGMPSDSSAPATPAIQVHKGNNFNPQQIIGRIE